jgi:hypothetical protein
MTTYLDYGRFAATPLETDPYHHIVVPQFVHPERFEDVLADFPDIRTPGSIPPSELDIRGRFAELMEEMSGDGFREAVEGKFGVDLAGRPTMYTVRGRCRRTDGRIHTDSETKIITVLLYLNRQWEDGGGRLRILRSGNRLDDYASEVPPHGGTLLIFRRAPNSWHGHEPFEGERRAIQLNWVTSQAVVDREQRRHRVSALFKTLNPFGSAA